MNCSCVACTDGELVICTIALIKARLVMALKHVKSNFQPLHSQAPSNSPATCILVARDYLGKSAGANKVHPTMNTDEDHAPSLEFSGQLRVLSKEAPI